MSHAESLLLGVDNKQLYMWKLLSKKILVLLRGSYNLFPFIITTILWSSKDKNEDDDNDNTTTAEYRISELTSTPQTPLNTQLSALVSTHVHNYTKTLVSTHVLN